MKLIQTFAAAMLALGAGSALSAQDAKPAPSSGQPAAAATAPAAAVAPVAVAPQYTEQQLLETFGWFVGKRIGLSELEFTKEQTDSIVKGLLESAGGQKEPFALDKIGPEMDKFMQGKQAQYLAKMKSRGLAESEKFLKEVKAKPGVVTLPSGLSYEIVTPGTGAYPKPTDSVKVNYTGTLVNGTKFDSSVDRGEPAEFTLSEVIQGWVEGIQKINKGGKIRLYIPPQLAYGDEPKPGIPPSSTLIFDVELLDIKAPAPTPTPAAGPAGPGPGAPDPKK